MDQALPRILTFKQRINYDPKTKIGLWPFLNKQQLLMNTSIYACTNKQGKQVQVATISQQPIVCV